MRRFVIAISAALASACVPTVARAFDFTDAQGHHPVASSNDKGDTAKSDDAKGDGDSARASRDDTSPPRASDSPAFRDGERIGRIIGFIGFPALIILVLVLVLRKKRTPPSYAPPYYGPGPWPPPQQGQWPGNPYGQQPPANPYQGQGLPQPPANQPPPGWTPPRAS